MDDEILQRAQQDVQQADGALREVERRTAQDRRRSGRPGGRRISDVPPDWVSVTEYAYRHSVDRRTVYKWMRAGLIEFYQVELLIRIRNVAPATENRTSAVHASTS